jgi:hypothetical protein
LVSGQRLSCCAGFDAVACSSVAPSAGASVKSHLFRCHTGRGISGRTHASSDSVQTDANLPQIWAMNGLGQSRRSSYITPLERAQLTCRSDRTFLKTRGHDVSARSRYPNRWPASRSACECMHAGAACQLRVCYVRCMSRMRR